MKVLLVGSEGNMGTRYKKILEYLKVPYSCYDKKIGNILEYAARDCDRSIVATPTEHHAESIVNLIEVMPGKPILCEKPIDKNIIILKEILKRCEETKTDFRMVMQYKKVYMDDGLIGPSHYDFYKHGNDTLPWDCIQIIGLARGTVTLAERSPVWSCAINGQMLKSQLMDWAYVQYIVDWLKSPTLCVGSKDIVEIHEKVLRFIHGSN